VFVTIDDRTAGRDRAEPRRGASILHADLDAFYASVEQRDDPSLRGLPVVVGGGVVLAASYEARARGVRTAMSGRQARALCPDVVVVEPRFAAYVEASRAVFAVFRDTTPLVEGLSIDEAFLDVGGLRRVSGTPVEIATRLRSRVRDEVGLAITVGVARTKFLAKVASAVAKPDGLLVVDPAGERDFLLPLPVRRLWGVGPVTADRLAGRGMHTVADVALADEAALVALLGPHAGRHLHSLAHGRDPRRVETGRRTRSVGAQSAFGARARVDLDARLAGLVDRVGRRLRRGGRIGSTITVNVRFADRSRASRSRSFAHPTGRTDDLLDAARLLLGRLRPLIAERGATLVGVSVGGLVADHPVQPPLPFSSHDPDALDAALDGARERFGSRAITRTALVGVRDLEVPQLADLAGPRPPPRPDARGGTATSSATGHRPAGTPGSGTTVGRHGEPRGRGGRPSAGEARADPA